MKKTKLDPDRVRAHELVHQRLESAGLAWTASQDEIIAALRQLADDLQVEIITRERTTGAKKRGR